MANEIERLRLATFQLVNLIAHASQSRLAGVYFLEATGVRLPPADLQTLLAVRAGGDSSVGHISRALFIDITQTSRQVSRLEGLGLVIRSADPDDRRRQRVSPTQRGRTVLTRWDRSWGSRFGRPVQGWTGEDVEALAAWYRQVYDCLVIDLADVPPERPEHREGFDGSPTERAFLHAVLPLVGFIGRTRGYDNLLTGFDPRLTEGTFFALRMVWRHGPTTAKEVAARLGIDPSQASKRLGRLREWGLIEPSIDPRDGRNVLLGVTAAGGTLLERIRVDLLRRFDDVLGSIDPGQARRVAPLAERYVQGLAEPDELPHAAQATG